MLKDALGDRMKEYENITRYKLSKKSLIVARIDGNAFHTYTKGLKRPFDEALIEDMDATAIYLCKEIQNVKFAFVQSDEISLFLREDGKDTQCWFDNNLQKMASVSASKATSEFNKCRYRRAFIDSSASIAKFEITPKDLLNSLKQAEFDARFWTLPSAIEVYNYFLWRQRDAEKNSISAAAQSAYSHKELDSINGLDKQEMLFRKGINWNNYPSGQKRGRFIEKITYLNDERVRMWRNEDDTKQYYRLDGPTPMKDTIIGDMNNDEWIWEKSEFPFVKNEDKVRNIWEVVECPIFSQEPDFLLNRIKLPEIK